MNKRLIIVGFVFGIMVLLSGCVTTQPSSDSELRGLGILPSPAAGRCSGLNKLAYADHFLKDKNFYLYLANGVGRQITNIQVTSNGDLKGTCIPNETTINATQDFNITCTGVSVSAEQSYSGTIEISYAGAGGATITETINCEGTAQT